MREKSLTKVSLIAAAAALLFAASPGLHAAQAEAEKNVAPVRIEVDAAQRANYSIPRTIFGTFLEPIGNATYNGLWAEILQNPSLEENLWSASRVAQMIRDEP